MCWIITLLDFYTYCISSHTLAIISQMTTNEKVRKAARPKRELPTYTYVSSHDNNIYDGDTYGTLHHHNITVYYWELFTFDLTSDLLSVSHRRRRDGHNRDHCIGNIVSLPYGHILIVVLLLLSISFFYKKHRCWFIGIALDQIIVIIQYAYYTLYRKNISEKVRLALSAYKYKHISINISNFCGVTNSELGTNY